MQWKFPELYDEDKFIILFGGLHLEKALWNVLRDLLQCSGWSEALVEAEIATSGTADSFRKVSHITRTRHAHQVTALALETLQHTAYVDQKTSVNFESWRLGMIESSQTFQFWDIILHTELSILAFIRAHRENKFALYVDCLDSLIYLFFALDHFNYSRWVSVHVRDMNALRILESDFQNHWVVQKTQKRFSKIPIDQVHEQENCKIKGKGGVIGITENQSALQRWLHGVLYVYGGTFEDGDKQITLNDFHSIDVRKFSEWKTIIKADIVQEWHDTDSGDSEEEEDESSK
ncbi:Kelch domain-containing protein 4 [Nymphon striatum]|nr:Kelch domain-containing protein 4 [Nymphon striatum]